MVKIRTSRAERATLRMLGPDQHVEVPRHDGLLLIRLPARGRWTRDLSCQTVLDRSSERINVPHGYEASVSASLEDLTRAARAIGGDDRNAAEQRLDEDAREPLPSGREREQRSMTEERVGIIYPARQGDLRL